MRHRDDDLEPFREDPVVKALTSPGTEAELADEAQAVAAFKGAVPPQRQRRSAARVATISTAGVLVLAVSGGVAAAYTSNLPDSWQAKLYNDLPSLHFPKPKAQPAPVVASTPPAPVSSTPSAPVPSRTPSPPASTSPMPTASVGTSAPASPRITATLPGVGGTATASAASSPTSVPTPTHVPGGGVTVAMTVAPGTRVPVGTPLTVKGELTATDGGDVANRRVVLVERIVGVPGRQRLGTARSDENGAVSFSVPAVERNVRLVLRARRHAHSTATRVVVIPLIHVQVASTAQGATSATVTMTVNGAQPGDVVVVRGANGSRQQAKLDASMTATFAVPASPSRQMHYRALIPRTRAHAAHSLAFYVPASG